MPSSYSALYYHFVFSTKHREKLIDPDWEDRLYGYIGGVLRNNNNHLLVAGGVEDHIHLLCSLSREDRVRDVLQLVKTNSSRWVRTTFNPEFAWQTGYGAFTVGHLSLPQVERYIRNQKAHHRGNTYEEEMRGIFKLSGIEIDERFFE